jgi:hypothetical protein
MPFLGWIAKGTGQYVIEITNREHLDLLFDESIQQDRLRGQSKPFGPEATWQQFSQFPL